MPDRESAWKELLERDAQRVLAFFWEDIHADLDWTRDVESLEQEFRALVPQAEQGKRVVDKLLRAFQKGTGDPRYLHVEIQATFEAGFERRVYVYNYRAEDRFSQPVVSLVLLLDNDPQWLPTAYRAEQYGTKRELTFRSAKIIGWRGHENELEAHPNPVALVVLAYLEGRRLEKDYEALASFKLRLLSRLLALGLPFEERGSWPFYFDWLLDMPDEYNRRVWDQFQASGEEAMKFVSWAERSGMEKGMEKGQRIGLIQGIALGLDLKFGEQGLALIPQLEQIEDLATLQAIRNVIKPATSLDDVRNLIPPPANGQH